MKCRSADRRYGLHLVLEVDNHVGGVLRLRRALLRVAQRLAQGVVAVRHLLIGELQRAHLGKSTNTTGRMFLTHPWRY